MSISQSSSANSLLILRKRFIPCLAVHITDSELGEWSKEGLGVSSRMISLVIVTLVELEVMRSCGGEGDSVGVAIVWG